MAPLLGVLSDAHGHGPAFAAALSALEREGAREFVFLGDAVGYIPSASVVRLIAGRDDITCVRGNHEAMVLGQATDAGADKVYQHDRTRALLDAEDVAQLRGWPATYQQHCAAGLALFVHGSPIDPTCGYVYPDTDLSAQSGDADFVFMGHTHRPFIRHHGRTCFVNVGSCGLPRDNGSQGAAAIFDTVTGDVRLLRFDITAATHELLASAPPLHPSVLALFARRDDDDQ